MSMWVRKHRLSTLLGLIALFLGAALGSVWYYLNSWLILPLL